MFELVQIIGIITGINVGLFIYAVIDIEKDYRNFKVEEKDLTPFTISDMINSVKNELRNSTFSVKIVIIFICAALSLFLLSIPSYMNYRTRKYIRNHPELFI